MGDGCLSSTSNDAITQRSSFVCQNAELKSNVHASFKKCVLAPPSEECLIFFVYYLNSLRERMVADLKYGKSNLEKNTNSTMSPNFDKFSH